jgi:hypothetical protein
MTGSWLGRRGAGGGEGGEGRTRGRDPRLSRFVRGVAIGALVGAAIAGSRIWQRSIARDERTTSDEPR